jgi:beta-lactamase regulating signal transducer with metallopeptidase domain
MQLLFEALTYHRGADAPLSVLVILVVRVTLVLVTALVASQMLRRSSAAVQHRLWLWALVGTLAVPALWAVTPGWRMPLLSMRVPAAVDWQPAFLAATRPASWSLLLGGLWLAGTLACLAYLLLGVYLARRAFKNTTACQDPRWLAALALAKRGLGVTRRIELRTATEPVSPAVWSFRRVRILLPDVTPDWSLAQRRSVLIHELAHVKRQDCIWQLLSSLVCAVWWFHPLVWYADRRLRTLGEQAADDCVLRAGTPRADYAGHLLKIAQWLGASPWLAVAVPALKPSHLELRLRSILDARRRRNPIGRRRALAGGILAGSLLVALATVTPTRVLVDPMAGSPQRIDWRIRIEPQPAAEPGPAPSPPANRSDEIVSRGAQPRVMTNPVPAEYVATRPFAIDVPPDDQSPRMVVPPNVGSGTRPLPATDESAFMLIPNWEAGRDATQLIPNYREGMATTVLVRARPMLSTVAEMAPTTATAIAGVASVD